MKKFKRLVLLTLVLFTLMGNKVLADESPVLKRLEGKNRVETSIQISKEAFNKSKYAILVGYNGEVDALTGTILAEELEAPILISSKRETDESFKLLKAEFKRLGTEKVFILGGTSAVDKKIENATKALGLSVERISGNNREATAINIAEKATSGKSDKAFLSLGYDVYAYALAIGPVAADENVPLLLTASGEIKQTTLDYIKNSNLKEITIVGGKDVIGAKVESTLKDMGISVTRINGNSREETAINIAKQYMDNPSKIVIVNGYKYADAVAGGYLAAKEKSPILLSDSSKLKDINKSYIEKKRTDTIVLGGKQSIDDVVFYDIGVGIGSVNAPTPNDSEKLDTNNTTSNNSKENVNSVGAPSDLAELKKEIRKELDVFEANINIKYNGKVSIEELRAIIQDIYNDGSYIGGTITSITPGIVKGQDTTEVKLSVKYRNNAEQEKFIEKEVNRITKSIINSKMSEFEKVKAVHDYIVNNTVYGSNTKHSAHSAYTVFKEGQAVCQGYALATYRLLDAIGIENYYIVGQSLNNGSSGDNWGSHAWNLVKIDGKYYNLDVTKDDPIVSDGNGILSYKYFLLSDKKFSKTHVPNRSNFPKATDSKYEVLNGANDPFEYNGSLYFGNKNDNNKLYSVSLKNFKLKKISDQKAPYVVVEKNTIYFSNYSQGGYIYKSDLNGKNLTRINKVHSVNLELQSQKIVFLNKSNNKINSIRI